MAPATRAPARREWDIAPGHRGRSTSERYPALVRQCVQHFAGRDLTVVGQAAGGEEVA